jgi:hypothetical protein
MAARADEGTVVFMIGMRINRLRAVKEWWPVAAAMPKMLRELAQDPELGLLGARGLYDPPRGITMIQYWRSTEALQAFASDPNHTHRPAWTAFFRAAYKGGAVGVWHETYVLGGHESVYVNMPVFGLGAAAELGGTDEMGNRAADRMRRAEAAPS